MKSNYTNFFPPRQIVNRCDDDGALLQGYSYFHLGQAEDTEGQKGIVGAWQGSKS